MDTPVFDIGSLQLQYTEAYVENVLENACQIFSI